VSQELVGGLGKSVNPRHQGMSSVSGSEGYTTSAPKEVISYPLQSGLVKIV